MKQDLGRAPVAALLVKSLAAGHIVSLKSNDQFWSYVVSRKPVNA